MDRVRGFRKRMRALFRPKDVQRETQAELSFHIAMETASNEAAGMSPEAARTAAMRSFGGVDRTVEAIRDVQRFKWWDDLRQDVRHAARMFSRAPGFTATAIITIALGCGANIAVFAVVNAVLLTPLPYGEPARLVRIWEASETANITHGDVSPGTFSDLRVRSRTLDGVALFDERDYLLSFGETSEELHGASVSPAMFDILGVRPVIGRTLTPEQAPQGGNSDREVVIAYDVWQQKLGGARDVIGRTLRLEGRTPLTIVGVMPAGFAFPAHAQVWTSEKFPGTIGKMQRQVRYYSAIGRLAPGIGLESARSETTRIARDLEKDYPASNAGWTVQMASLDESIVGDTRPTLLALSAFVVCLLLIACLNVANLTVARTTSRSHEVAVRSSLGAGSSRLMRQWMTEGVVLASVGCAAGFAIAYGAVHMLTAVAPVDIPRLDEVRFGRNVLSVAILLTCFSAVISGAAPAIHFRKLGVSSLLRSGTRTTGAGGVRFREWINAAEVALTLVLLVSSILLMSSFIQLRSVDLGFRPHNLLSAELRIPRARFVELRPWGRIADHYDGLFTALRASGMHNVAGVTELPLTGENLQGAVWRTDAPGASGRRPPTSAADQWKATMLVTTPAYFSTMNIPITRGRPFTSADRFADEQLTDTTGNKPEGVAIINEAAAALFWPGMNPIGKRIVLFDDFTFAAARVIVGVSKDVRATAVSAPASPAIFVPFAQHPVSKISIIVQSDARADELQRSFVTRVRAFDNQISISKVQRLDQIVAGSVSRPRFNLVLVASFAAIALTLSLIGVFGVAGYIVTLRTHEIGIRMALGARRAEIHGLVFKSGLQSVLVGMLAGTLLAAIAALGIRALLFGVQPIDVKSFVVALAVLIGSCSLAVAIPAARAGRVKPIQALRGS